MHYIRGQKSCPRARRGWELLGARCGRVGLGLRVFELWIPGTDVAVDFSARLAERLHDWAQHRLFGSELPGFAFRFPVQ
jgi:hypothetical protein